VLQWLLGPTRPGGIILDPFAGGGTTGVAAKRMGRLFLGFEIDAYWCDYANRRIGAQPSETGTPLFGLGA
jgi:DNA modification methylase